MTKIKDIYAGKPDAKDEIETEGMDPFFENYVVPSNFNINAITDGSGAFVTGYLRQLLLLKYAYRRTLRLRGSAAP